MWRTPLRIPFRDSIEVACWPGARMRSSVPLLAIMALDSYSDLLTLRHTHTQTYSCTQTYSTHIRFGGCLRRGA
eukprot:9034656-Pyramimonas_sp.AAC.1